MGDDFGSTLRELRKAAGMSLAGLAEAIHYSKSLVGQVEAGGRKPAHVFAEACDRALGTTPLLGMLCGATTRGDDMLRRELLRHVGTLTAAGVGLGTVGLAETLRRGLLDDAGIPEDWEATAAGHARTFVAAPNREYGAHVLTDLMLLGAHIRTAGPRPELFRAGATLSMFCGLWLGNQAEYLAARRQYRSAVALAQHAGDQPLAHYIAGSAAARGTYEGASVAETEQTIAQVLAEAGDALTVGVMEAHSASAHLGALLGDAPRARAAVMAMRRVADHLAGEPDPWGAWPVPRALHVGAWVEGRVGTFVTAQQACEEARGHLDNLPMWVAELDQFRARAMVAAGDVTGGVRYALGAARAIEHDVAVIAVAIRDVVDQVPGDVRTDELVELRRYASPNPGPWDTIR